MAAIAYGIEAATNAGRDGPAESPGESHRSRTEEYLGSRARRADAVRFQVVLAKVPAEPPALGDELEPPAPQWANSA